MLSNVWIFIGIALLAWVAWDIYAGYTYLFGLVSRDTQPGLYWVVIVVWAALAFSCFVPWGG